MKFKKLNLDDGIYKDAESNKISAAQMIEEIYQKESGEESPYQGLSTNHEYLLKYKLMLQGKEVPLTALEKQLAANDIKVSGWNSDKVEKFYSNSASTILFPAYISEKINAGIMLKSPLSEFIMDEDSVNSTSYQKMKMTEIESKRQAKKAVEGSELREISIETSEDTIKLGKFGCYLQTTYEAIKYQKINIFGRMLEKVGLQVGIDEFDEFINVMKNGDGTPNTAMDSTRTYSTATSGTISIADIIGWSSKLPSEYKMKKFVAKKASLNQYKTTIATMNNPKDQFGYIQIDLPKLFEWDRDVLPADEFYGIDNNYALIYLMDGSLLVEYENIIRKQLKGAAISKRSGFAIFDTKAIARFDINHT